MRNENNKSFDYSLPPLTLCIDSTIMPSACAPLFSIVKGTIKIAHSLNCVCRAMSTSPQESCPISHHRKPHLHGAPCRPTMLPHDADQVHMVVAAQLA